MKIVGFFRVGGLMVGLAAMLLAGPLSGCTREKQTPVGEVLEYDPANDPTVKAAEEYMKTEEPKMRP